MSKPAAANLDGGLKMSFEELMEQFQTPSDDESASDARKEEKIQKEVSGKRNKSTSDFPSHELYILMQEIKTALSFGGSRIEEISNKEDNKISENDMFRDEIRSLIAELRSREKATSKSGGPFEAKIRAYERRLKEKDMQLMREREYRKRAERLARDSANALSSFESQTAGTIKQLYEDLDDSKSNIRQLNEKLLRKEKVHENWKAEKNRLEHSVSSLRDDLLDANYRCKKSALEADYHRRRAISIEMKAMQAKNSQRALQLRVQELQDVQNQILQEMKASRRGRSKKDLASPKERVRKLAKKRSELVSKIANLLTRGNSRESTLGDGTESPKERSEDVQTSESQEQAISPSPSSPASSNDAEPHKSEGPRLEHKSSYTVKEYLEVSDGAERKLFGLFKRKPSYHQTLEMTRQDVERHGNVLKDIMNIKEMEIERLTEELDMERLRSRGLGEQLERVRRNRKREVKYSNEKDIESAKQEINFSIQSSGHHKTLFEWRDMKNRSENSLDASQ